MAVAVLARKPKPLCKQYGGTCVEDNFELLWRTADVELADVLGLFWTYVLEVFDADCGVVVR